MYSQSHVPFWELMYLYSVTKPSRDGNLGGHWWAESSTMTFENRIYHDTTSGSKFSSKRNQNITKLAKTKTQRGETSQNSGLGRGLFTQVPSDVRLRPFSVTLWPLAALLGQHQPALIALSGHCWLHRCRPLPTPLILGWPTITLFSRLHKLHVEMPQARHPPLSPLVASEQWVPAGHV